MKLLSMTDFVLEQKETPTLGMEQYDWCMSEMGLLNNIRNYAKFISQPITLSMFVPVDEIGSILYQPCEIINTDECRHCACREYLKAKDKVLFEGFSICNRLESVKCVENGDLHFSYDKAIESNETVETLVKYRLELTDTAKKQIFG